MMKRMIAGLIGLIAAVVLVACTNYSGPATIVQKDHDAGGYEYGYGPCEAKPGTYCYGYHYVIPSWSIRVQFYDPNANKTEHESYDVSERQYDSVHVGQKIQLDQGQPEL